MVAPQINKAKHICADDIRSTLRLCELFGHSSYQLVLVESNLLMIHDFVVHKKNQVNKTRRLILSFKDIGDKLVY